MLAGRVLHRRLRLHDRAAPEGTRLATVLLIDDYFRVIWQRLRMKKDFISPCSRRRLRLGQLLGFTLIVVVQCRVLFTKVYGLRGVSCCCRHMNVALAVIAAISLLAPRTNMIH